VNDIEETRRVTAVAAESPVLRKIPLRVRTRLDAALIHRSTTGETMSEIGGRLKLDKFGVTSAELERYAEMLEELIRPIACSQFVAGVLGCLPAAYRRRLMTGNQILLMSKVAKILSQSNKEEFAAGELVKLANVLRAAAQPRVSTRQSRSAKAAGKQDPKDATIAAVDFLSDERVIRDVRSLYGLTWPLPISSVMKKQARESESLKSEISDLNISI
jgi:hypothetical protein